MSSSKNYQRYSAAWLTLFDAMKEDPYRRIEVVCPDLRAAKALRLEFYKAREAFLNDEDMCREYGEVLNSREVRQEELTVVYENKDRTWLAEAIDKAVSRENGEGN